MSGKFDSFATEVGVLKPDWFDWWRWGGGNSKTKSTQEKKDLCSDGDDISLPKASENGQLHFVIYKYM